MKIGVRSICVGDKELDRESSPCGGVLDNKKKNGEKESEFGRKEGDNGTVHGGTRTKVP